MILFTLSLKHRFSLTEIHSSALKKRPGFWIKSSSLWNIHCRRHLSAIQHDWPECPKEERKRVEIWVILNLDFRLLLFNVWSKGNEMEKMGPRLAKQWENRDCGAHILKRDPFPSQQPGSGCYCVPSRQSAELQQDEERWTLCLCHWCLVLKRSQSGRTTVPDIKL